MSKQILCTCLVVLTLTVPFKIRAGELEELREQVRLLTKSVDDLKKQFTEQRVEEHVPHQVESQSGHHGHDHGKESFSISPRIGSVIDTISQYSSDTGIDFIPRTVELTLMAEVDQFALGYIVLNAGTEIELDERTGFLRRHDGNYEVQVEEAAIETTSLPYGLKVKGGQFFADFTKLGKVHPHDRPFIDGPRSVDTVIGGETLARGFEVSYTPEWMNQYARLTGGFVDGIGSEIPNATVDLPDGSTHTLFRGRRDFQDMTYYARGETAMELGSVKVEFGADYATNFDAERRQIASADLLARWKPFNNRKDAFVWGAEALWQREQAVVPTLGLGAIDTDGDGVAETPVFTNTGTQFAQGAGFYTYAQYRFGKYWEPGVRYDFTRPDIFEFRDTDADGFNETFTKFSNDIHTYSAYLTAYPSESQRLRLQFSYVGINEDNFFAGGNVQGPRDQFQVWLQWTVFLGEHKH